MSIGSQFYSGLRSRRPYDADDIPRLLALASQGRVTRLAAELAAYLEEFLPAAIKKKKSLDDYRANPYVSMTTASTMRLTEPRDFAMFFVNLKLYMGLETSFGKMIETVVMGHYPAAPECADIVRQWEEPVEKQTEFSALAGLTREARSRARNESVWREIDRSCIVADRRYLMTIKSGPQTINDSQVAAMKDAIRDRHPVWLRASIDNYAVSGIDVVIGLSYGTDASTNNKENQILNKLQDSGFSPVIGAPGVLSNPDGTVRVYRVIGADYWAFTGCPSDPSRTPGVFLEVLLALAKALRDMDQASVEQLLNERLALLGDAIKALRVPDNALPTWIADEFTPEELTWLAAAMSTFFDPPDNERVTARRARATKPAVS